MTLKKPNDSLLGDLDHSAMDHRKQAINEFEMTDPDFIKCKYIEQKTK